MSSAEKPTLILTFFLREKEFLRSGFLRGRTTREGGLTKLCRPGPEGRRNKARSEAQRNSGLQKLVTERAPEKGRRKRWPIARRARHSVTPDGVRNCYRLIPEFAALIPGSIPSALRAWDSATRVALEWSIRLNAGFYLSKSYRPATFPDARTHFRQNRARECRTNTEHSGPGLGPDPARLEGFFVHRTERWLVPA